MPPADPAALSAALATVRNPHLPQSLMTFDANYQDACELLARELVRLLDSGEAVRVKGNEDRQSLGEVAYKAYVRSGCYAGSWPFVAEAVLAAALEPLIAKEVGT